MADPRNFLVSSDYPQDKIIFLYESSMTVTDSTIDSINIPNTLGFAFLPLLVWSNNSNFSISNTLADNAYYTSAFTTAAGQSYEATCDSSNINISRYNFSGSTQTVYYRVYGFPPSGLSNTTDVLGTANSGDRFILDTDNNYMKLFHAGKLTTTDKTYTHALGYTPRVLIWGLAGGIYTYNIGGLLVDTDPTGAGALTGGVTINTSQIEWLNPASFTEVEYRIYADE